VPATDPDAEPGSATAESPAYPSDRNVLEPDCTRCSALVESRECISWGTGPLEADVVVVGEAPGYGNPDADPWRGGNWTGKAYTSRHSGRRIRRMVDEIGYGDDAYYTNAVKCFPASEEPRSSESANGETVSQDPKDPTSNREPTPEERANCRTHLLTELEEVDPTVVLATGKHATKTVLAAEDRTLEGFIDSVLEPVRCERLDVWLVPILHPSYQDVWIGRLGYEPDEYLEAIGETLDELCGPSGKR
jgi:uracil-DNA glycosylase